MGKFFEAESTWQRDVSLAHDDALGRVPAAIPSQDLCFMVLDVTLAEAHDGCGKQCVAIYGVQQDGRTVRVDVLDFRPYFFVLKKPAPCDTRHRFSEALSRLVAADLRPSCRGSRDRAPSPKKRKPSSSRPSPASESKGSACVADDGDNEVDDEIGESVVSVESVVGQSIMYYRGSEISEFWKISVSSARVKSVCLEMIRRPEVSDFVLNPRTPYEANVDLVTRLMVDAQIVGGGWATLSASSYERVANGSGGDEGGEDDEGDGSGEDADGDRSGDVVPRCSIHVTVSWERSNGQIFSRTSGNPALTFSKANSKASVQSSSSSSSSSKRSTCSRNNHLKDFKTTPSTKGKRSVPPPDESPRPPGAPTEAEDPPNPLSPPGAPTEVEDPHELCPIAPLRVLTLSTFAVVKEEAEEPTAKHRKRKRPSVSSRSSKASVSPAKSSSECVGSSALTKGSKESATSGAMRPLDFSRDPLVVISCSARWELPAAPGGGSEYCESKDPAPSNDNNASHYKSFKNVDTIFVFDDSSNGDDVSTRCDDHGHRTIGGVEVFRFHSEREMLVAFRRFFLLIDPDIVSGFDVSTVHLPYIFGRAAAHGIENFTVLGRDKKSRAKLKKIQTYSAAWVKSKRRMAATSNQESADLVVAGRLLLDVTRIAQTSHSLRTYTVSQICETFLGAPEELIPPPSLAALFASPHLRDALRVLRYTHRQCVTSHLVLGRLMTVIQTFELARATGILPAHVHSRGQMARAWSLLLRYARRFGCLVPRVDSRGVEMEHGPLVFDPTVLNTTGLHDDPVVVMDFASLYPSIMIAHNLSYDTLIHPGDVSKYKKSDYHVSPVGHHFIKQKHRVGILSNVLDELIKARASVKELLKEHADTPMAAVLEGRQKALKITTNAVYGFTGSNASKLMCVEIAESTITHGASMLQRAAEWVRDNCAEIAQTIYGDTDSLMVKVRGWSVNDAIRFGHETSGAISRLFPAPVKLRFEKVYHPFLLQHTKHYAGVIHTEIDEASKTIDVKGLECVRRDTIPLVKDLMSKVLEDLLLRRSPTMAVARTQRAIARVLSGEVSMHDLIITKALWRGTGSESYPVKMAHTELAARMLKRDPGFSVSLGERLRYVFLKGDKGARQHELSEDPLFASQHNSPIDYSLYVENYLKKPMVRIFALPHVLRAANADGTPSSGGVRAAEEVFQGAHMRVKSPSGPPARSSNASSQRSIGSFFTSSRSSAGGAFARRCIECRRSVLRPHSPAAATGASSSTSAFVCDRCVERFGGVARAVARAMRRLRDAEARSARVASRCVECQHNCSAVAKCSAGAKERPDIEKERLEGEKERSVGAKERSDIEKERLEGEKERSEVARVRPEVARVRSEIARKRHSDIANERPQVAKDRPRTSYSGAGGGMGSPALFHAALCSNVDCRVFWEKLRCRSRIQSALSDVSRIEAVDW